MLDSQPELQVVDIYVALTKTPTDRRVAYGSLSLGVGERKILSKTFTVFRSPRTGGLYVSWPGYPSQVDGKTVYKDYDMWIDVDEAKHWAFQIIGEVNKKLGVTTSTTTNKEKLTTDVPPVEEPVEKPPVIKKAGWKKVK